jgi:hypothetical protein
MAKLTRAILVVLSGCIQPKTLAFSFIFDRNSCGQRIARCDSEARCRTKPLSSSLGSSEASKGSLAKPKIVKKKNLKTFARYLEVECWREAQLRSLEPVLLAAADACKQISRIVSRAMTDDVYGAALGKDGLPLEENVQGEVQQKLDVLCNTIMLRAFCGSSRSINSVASEEEDEPRCCSDVMVSRARRLPRLLIRWIS